MTGRAVDPRRIPVLAVLLLLATACGPALIGGAASGSGGGGSGENFSLANAPTIDGGRLRLEFSADVNADTALAGIEIRFVIDDPLFPIDRQIEFTSEPSGDPRILQLAPLGGIGFGVRSRLRVTLTDALRSARGTALGNAQTVVAETDEGGLESDVRQISDSARRASVPRAASSEDGSGLIIWLDRPLTGGTNRLLWSSFAPATDMWSEPAELTTEIIWLSRLIRIGDTALVVYATPASDSLQTRVFQWSTGAWTTGPALPAPLPGNRADRVLLDANSNGDVVAAWNEFQGLDRTAPVRSHAALLPAGSTEWQRVVDFDHPPGLEASLCKGDIGDNGDVIVGWTELDRLGRMPTEIGELRVRGVHGNISTGFVAAEELDRVPTVLFDPSGAVNANTNVNSNLPTPLGARGALLWSVDGVHLGRQFESGTWNTRFRFGESDGVFAYFMDQTPDDTVHAVGLRAGAQFFLYIPTRILPSGQTAELGEIPVPADALGVSNLALVALSNETALVAWQELAGARSNPTPRIAVTAFAPGDEAAGDPARWSLPIRLGGGTSQASWGSNALGEALLGYLNDGVVEARWFR